MVSNQFLSHVRRRPRNKNMKTVISRVCVRGGIRHRKAKSDNIEGRPRNRLNTIAHNLQNATPVEVTK